MQVVRPPNTDAATVAGFGDEWSRFNWFGDSTSADRDRLFQMYFSIFPWGKLPADGGVGADVGCGSGRWARVVAPRVAKLHLIDPSEKALNIARRNLGCFSNVEYHVASADSIPLPDSSLDFAYSLGVLMCVPDTGGAVKAIAKKLKRGAPLLVYIYYALENRPRWYRGAWQLTNLVRRLVSRLPPGGKFVVSDMLAALVYWPFARTARLLHRRSALPSNWPLACYRDASFYVMRNDALDRFGTRLEKRYTRQQIAEMMHAAGLIQVRFDDSSPYYWFAVGYKAH
jgi:ubiquinone/menaquinone biosynthesis C-methylase UbiE